MQEIQAQSLGGEDPLEKEMATYSSIRAWEIPWTEEPGGPQSTEVAESNTTEWLTPSYLAILEAGILTHIHLKNKNKKPAHVPSMTIPDLKGLYSSIKSTPITDTSNTFPPAASDQSNLWTSDHQTTHLPK